MVCPSPGPQSGGLWQTISRELLSLVQASASERNETTGNDFEMPLSDLQALIHCIRLELQWAAFMKPDLISTRGKR